ncbi:MAG: hypothetical protein ACLQIB_54375, partial [Isosphaeraceae bacterium]
PEPTATATVETGTASAVAVGSGLNKYCGRGLAALCPLLLYGDSMTFQRTFPGGGFNLVVRLGAEGYGIPRGIEATSPLLSSE